MDLLNQLCLKYARELIDIGQRQILYCNKIKTHEIIAGALQTCDSMYGIRKYEDYEYINQAENHPDLLHIYSSIQLLCKTYKNKTTDKNLDTKKKTELYYNSIHMAETLYKDLQSKNNYYVSEGLKTKHNTILENCYAKVEIEDIDTILDLLKKTDTNFILQYDDGYCFYPLIVDFLFDTLTFECAYEHNKDLVDVIKTKFDLLSIKRDVLEITGYIFYSKVDFIRQVGRKKVHLYLLHEYTKKFKCDLSIMRELYKELLYWNPNSHPTALKSKQFNIQDIIPPEFILSQSKLVINFSEEPTQINFEYLPLSPILLIPSFQNNNISI